MVTELQEQQVLHQVLHGAGIAGRRGKKQQKHLTMTMGAKTGWSSHMGGVIRRGRGKNNSGQRGSQNPLERAKKNIYCCIPHSTTR